MCSHQDNFYSLTPTKIENWNNITKNKNKKNNCKCIKKPKGMIIYKEALDFVFNKKNNDILNIAITGIYGSGKSSIWKTYLEEKRNEKYFLRNKNKNFKNVITISIGKYDIDSNGKNDHNTQQKNRVERQIINQIAAQINPKKIPLGKYKFKKNKNFFRVILNTLFSFLLIFSVITWFTKDFWIENIDENAKKYLFLLYILFFVPIIYFLYTFFVNNKIQISKINLKAGEAEIQNKEASDETIFDREIKEIVYLLYSSKTNVLVIEDLDRNDDPLIFTKLRELNFLINKYYYQNSKFKKVKFIYMIRDEIFHKFNDRTKFFEFIIPVVPIKNAKNSKNLLYDFFKNNLENENINMEGKIPSIDEEFLLKISSFVKDIRLLKNIYNEYNVYKNIIFYNNLNLDANKLFSLVTLKNVFPNEFDNLQEDEGYIHDMINKINFYEYDDEKKVWNKKNAENKTNAIQDQKTKSINSENDINAPQNKEIKTNDVKKTRNSTEFSLIKEYLEKGRYSEIEEIFNNKENALFGDPDFALIKFLIINNWIDETYPYYKSYFGKDELSSDDEIYIENLIFKNDNSNFNKNIQNPKLVLEKIKENDLNKTNLLNKDLLKYSLNNFEITDSKLKNKIKLFISKNKEIIEKNDLFYELAFMLNLLEVWNIETFILNFKNDMNFLNKILMASRYNGEFHRAYTNIIVIMLVKNILNESNLKKYKSYIEESSNILKFIDISDYNGYSSSFFEILHKNEIKFQDLSWAKKAPKKNLCYIKEKDLYYKNKENESILKENKC
ncbi:YobI family P-loop NTPase [Candidatus Mycoplasma pogonae]